METSRRTDVRLEVLGGPLERATPVARYRIEADIAPDEARARLAARLAQPMVEGGESFFQVRRTWVGQLSGDEVRVVGPRGSRQWTMVAEGQVAAGRLGTAVELRVRPAAVSLISVCLIAVWVAVAVTIFWGTVMTPFPILMGCVLYLVAATTMRSEARHIARTVAMALKY